MFSTPLFFALSLPNTLFPLFFLTLGLHRLAGLHHGTNLSDKMDSDSYVPLGLLLLCMILMVSVLADWERLQDERATFHANWGPFCVQAAQFLAVFICVLIIFCVASVLARMKHFCRRHSHKTALAVHGVTVFVSFLFWLALSIALSENSEAPKYDVFFGVAVMVLSAVSLGVLYRQGAPSSGGYDEVGEVGCTRCKRLVMFFMNVTSLLCVTVPMFMHNSLATSDDLSVGIIFASGEVTVSTLLESESGLWMFHVTQAASCLALISIFAVLCALTFHIYRGNAWSHRVVLVALLLSVVMCCFMWVSMVSTMTEWWGSELVPRPGFGIFTAVFAMLLQMWCLGKFLDTAEFGEAEEYRRVGAKVLLVGLSGMAFVLSILTTTLNNGFAQNVVPHGRVGVFRGESANTADLLMSDRSVHMIYSCQALVVLSSIFSLPPAILLITKYLGIFRDKINGITVASVAAALVVNTTTSIALIYAFTNTVFYRESLMKLEAHKVIGPGVFLMLSAAIFEACVMRVFLVTETTAVWQQRHTDNTMVAVAVVVLLCLIIIGATDDSLARSPEHNTGRVIGLFEESVSSEGGEVVDASQAFWVLALLATLAAVVVLVAHAFFGRTKRVLALACIALSVLFLALFSALLTAAVVVAYRRYTANYGVFFAWTCSLLMACNLAAFYRRMYPAEDVDPSGAMHTESFTNPQAPEELKPFEVQLQWKRQTFASLGEEGRCGVGGKKEESRESCNEPNGMKYQKEKD